MARYSVIRDFVSTSATGTLPYDLSTVRSEQLADHLDLDPAWVIAVVRWKLSVTFSRDLMATAKAISNSNLADILDVMVIDGDVVQMRVDGSKESFSPQMSATLMPNRDYLAEILPDDWVFAWIVNSSADAKNIVTRINSREACNHFLDGLKFVGRVNSVRETIGVTEDGGLKTLRYALNCSAFKELNSQIFYNQYLAQNFPSIGEYLGALGTSLNKLIDANGGGIDSNLILPELVEILLGAGVSKQFAAPGGLNIAAGGVSTSDGSSSTEAPYAYVIPADVATLLGQSKPTRASGVFSFADILDTVIGVQRYSMDQGSAGDVLGPQIVFTPDNVDSEGIPGSRSTTGHPLLGTFLPQAVSFTDNSVWTILSQFLNPAVNEMYASLRANAIGDVVPTLVVRQLPFTTPIGAQNAPSNVAVTPFLELPRWHLHPILIRGIERGRSSALRHNFIMVTGQDIMMQANNSPTEQVVRNPPIRDDADAKRNGLHPYQLSVACSQQDTTGYGISTWLQIISDFLMGQEMTLNGTFTTVGIQAPIAVGDNLEYNGVVYHIENVSHTCEIGALGKKRFSTILAVSHGILADTSAQKSLSAGFETDAVTTTNSDVQMYFSVRNVTGTGGTSIADGAPAVTSELKSGERAPIRTSLNDASGPNSFFNTPGAS
jgi:hypothetical protein